MRRRIIIFLLLIALVLLGAAAGHFLLGWWQPSYPVVTETSGGGDVTLRQTATLPEVLETARQALKEIESNVRDYSAVIVSQERIGNKLVERTMFVKIREKPFSAYLYFLAASNEDIKGREVLYIQGRNNGNLTAHTPGLLDKTLGKLNLPPGGLLAMNGQRHPITDLGLSNLCRQLIQRGEAAEDPGQVKVQRCAHARINTRACTLLEVTFPVREKKNWAYLARIFLDDERHFPIRVEIYELPRDRKQGPQLAEEYTYLDLKLNNGYTDADFEPKNRQYKFP
jgi:outer membrane lipoprotein-sorting protein